MGSPVVSKDDSVRPNHNEPDNLEAPMLKTLMVGVALSAFALSGAMAQSNPSTSTPSASPTPPSTQSSSPSSAPSNMSKSSSDMSKSASSSSGQSTSGAKFVTSQSSDQWLARSEEHTSELQSQFHLVCRLLLEKKKKQLTSPRMTRTTPSATSPPTTTLHPSSRLRRSEIATLSTPR